MPKRKRRAAGEGHIRQRPNGLWEARYTGLDGKTRSLYASTQRQVIAKLRETTAGGVAFDASRTTFGEFLDRWLRDSVKGNVRERTYDAYETRIRRHVQPELGRIKLKDLGPAHLQGLYRLKMDEGLSASTVRGVHATISRALSQAVRWRLIEYNPASSVDKPKGKGPEIEPLTHEEVTRLLKTIRGHRLEALIVVAATCGLRAGELVGLRWQDVDYDGGAIRVRQQLVNTSTGTKVGPPKRPSSKRAVLLPKIAADALRRREKIQLEERAAAGPLWEETDLVFTTLVGKRARPDNLSQRLLRPMMVQAGLGPRKKLRLHDLRHTFATLMLLNGEHPKVVADLMGHSSTNQTLNTYSHVLPSMGRGAVDRLNDLLEEDEEAV